MLCYAKSLQSCPTLCDPINGSPPGSPSLGFSRQDYWQLHCTTYLLWSSEGLGAGGEGDDRGWDGWMASPPRWTWVWVNSGSWWWTGRPHMLQFMGSQRVGHDWATELNWTELNWLFLSLNVQRTYLLQWSILNTVHWFILYRTKTTERKSYINEKMKG